MITRKDAYLQTLWNNLPIGIRHAIKRAIEEGEWWIDVMKDTDDGKFIVQGSILNALEELGYTVDLTDESISTYRILWK